MVTTAGLVPELMLANPGAAPVTVDIDVFTPDGPTPAAVSVEVEPDVPTRVPLGDLADGAFGIRVSAAGPISAVVVSEDLPPEPTEGEEAPPDDGADDGSEEEPEVELTRIAGTVGAREPAKRWLLPGAGSAPDARSSLWIMNTNPEVVTVTLQPVSAGALPTDKLQVEPGTITRVNVDEALDIRAYIIDGTLPITAAWSAQADRGVVFVAGIAIGE